LPRVAPTYDDDTLAAAGGIRIGEMYNFKGQGKVAIRIV